MEKYSAPKKMKRLGDLFEKYRSRIKAPQASVEKVCVQVITEVTGYALTTEQVSYTVGSRTLSLQLPSILKSEIRFHHKEILKKIKEQLGEDVAPKMIL